MTDNACNNERNTSGNVTYSCSDCDGTGDMYDGEPCWGCDGRGSVPSYHACTTREDEVE